MIKEIKEMAIRLQQLARQQEAVYQDINPQATANYISYYREMWDEDSENRIVKNEKEGRK